MTEFFLHLESCPTSTNSSDNKNTLKSTIDYADICELFSVKIAFFLSTLQMRPRYVWAGDVIYERLESKHILKQLPVLYEIGSFKHFY